MTTSAHLWAVGYDDVSRAEQVRNQMVKLSEAHCLLLLDTAVAVRYNDASLTLDGQPFVSALNLGSYSFASFLAGLALGAPPLTEAAVGLVETAIGGTAAAVGIDDVFIKEVETLMKPGSSVLFVLDREGDMDAILHGIRGLGGTVLKTNVDVRRARLIQSTLASAGVAMKDRT